MGAVDPATASPYAWYMEYTKMKNAKDIVAGKKDKSIRLLLTNILEHDPTANPGFHSAHTTDSTMTHEIGHALHHKRLVKELGMSIEDYRWKLRAVEDDRNPLGSIEDRERAKKVSEKVSRYATLEPLELVAEVFAGVRAGNEYDDEVMDLYEKLQF